MRIRFMVAALGLVSIIALARAQPDEAEAPPRAGERARKACRRASDRRGWHVVYVKSEHTLCLLQDEGVAWSASASHGRNPGKKRFEGDGRTPEGAYTLSPARKSKSFGTFLAISYPAPEDARSARAQGKHPGSSVGIHGPQSWYAFLGSWQAAVDHSDGCIVLDRAGISQLAARVTKPLPLDIVP